MLLSSSSKYETFCFEIQKTVEIKCKVNYKRELRVKKLGVEILTYAMISFLTLKNGEYKIMACKKYWFWFNVTTPNSFV